VKIYLFLYNLIHTIGWACVFIICIFTLREGLDSLASIFTKTQTLISFLQVLVFVDIVNDTLEFVPPPDMNVLVRLHCKVLRRGLIYFGALYFIPEIQNHIASGIMIFIWALLDLIRYPFYALNTFKICPEFLIQIRYSEFIVLYPLGFVSEIWVWCLMIPYIQSKQLHHWTLPGVPWISFNFHYFVICYLIFRFCSFPINFKKHVGNEKKTSANTKKK